MDFGWVDSRMRNDLLQNLEEMRGYPLDAKLGQDVAHNPETSVAAYDESINKFSALEGTAFFTSHSLIKMEAHSYSPLNLLTMYFYTRSVELHRLAPSLRFSDSTDIDSQKDYLKDKIDFILSTVPENSILFIDGPIIAGDVYTTFLSSEKRFHERNILPVFFVKNSDSNMVIDNIPGLRDRYNSDLHWSFYSLKKGERSCFFRYADRNNERNTKVFCYLKTYDVSPQRIEFFTKSFETRRESVNPVMNMIYYLTLAQGDSHNPQIRPIAIAEKYARETLKLVDFNRMMREIGLQPTMNQERFAW
jgi:hypothetical protein